MTALAQGIARVPEVMRGAFGAGRDEALTAGLVAAPFAGAAGIWINALTWWPDALTFGATVLLWFGLALWIAGFRREARPE